MSDAAFIRPLVGKHVDSLEGDDWARFWDLYQLGRAALDNGLIERVPVAYGDGKKSRYGVTYADELTGEFS